MGFKDGSGISWTTCKQSAPCSSQVTTPTPNHSLSTGRMLFLMPKQQCQALNAVPLITDKYVTVQMNTAGAVKLGRVQIILLIIGRQAIVVINNSERFTYSPAPCSDSHQQKLIIHQTCDRDYSNHCSLNQSTDAVGSIRGRLSGYKNFCFRNLRWFSCYCSGIQ